MRKKNSYDLGRREFLVAGTTGMLGTAAFGSSLLAGTAKTGEVSPREASNDLATGYWKGSDRRADLGMPIGTMPGSDLRTEDRYPDRFRPNVIPAASLAGGDSGLVRTGIRLTIHGLSEAGNSVFRPRIGSLSARVQFSILDKGKSRTVPFLAWHFQDGPLRSISHPVAMRVPIDPVTGLRITLERIDAQRGSLGRLMRTAVFGGGVQSGTPDGAFVKEFRFTPGSRAHQPRLRRGVYFLASGDRFAESSPDWRQYQFLQVGKEEGIRRLVRMGPFGLEPADFDYLVVSIDADGQAPVPTA